MVTRKKPKISAASPSKAKPRSAARASRGPGKPIVGASRAPRTISPALWKRLAEREFLQIIAAAVQEKGLAKWQRGLPAQGWGADIQLVSGPVMRRLNNRYRRKDYATDVLSFPAPGPIRALGMLGELVVCIPVLKRQAREQGHSPEQELRVLLVHGLLHLLGMDHERGEAEALLQRRWEEALLERLGRTSKRNALASKGLIARAIPGSG